jgi:magnesium chelatase subunit I
LASGYRAQSVRMEMRRNLLRRLTTGEPILPGIIGYEETVLPEIENAVLAGHHIVFLGERGQGKSRIIRGLVGLLDPAVPAIAGCPINDEPTAPVCATCRRRAAAEGDALPIVWITPDQRYAEKLATPDVSMADLIGEVDPIKVAEGRYLADEETIHFGLVPRTNRGVFAVNELPDLTEKVQVGLFNLMEEKDVQIKGYKIRLPLDVVIFASANPEDYTSRGRIITPLKDRFDVQIRTHYPRTIEHEIAIVEQETAGAITTDLPVRVPPFLKEIVAQITMEARASSEINQSSGVSVRVSINNYETLVSNAEKRAVRAGEAEIVPRVTDLAAIVASTAGKVELEYGGEEKGETDLFERLISRAVLRTWDKYLTVEACERVVGHFEAGWGVEVSDRMRADEYQEGLRQIPGLPELVARLVGPVESPGLLAAATELVLEGLHLHQKLNKAREGGRITYRA